jgi:hypothetical protein
VGYWGVNKKSRGHDILERSRERLDEKVEEKRSTEQGARVERSTRWEMRWKAGDKAWRAKRLWL